MTIRMAIIKHKISGDVIHSTETSSSRSYAFECGVVDDIDFSGADLRDLFVNNETVEGGEFKGADFTGSDFDYTTFKDCNFEDAILDNCMLEDAEFINCNMKGVRFEGANVRDTVFTDSELDDDVYWNKGDYYYSVFISPSHVQAGCQGHSPSEWEEFSESDIDEMDGEEALEFFPILLDLMDEHLARFKRPSWLGEED